MENRMQFILNHSALPRFFSFYSKFFLLHIYPLVYLGMLIMLILFYLFHVTMGS